jgi:hypothetical protein
MPEDRTTQALVEIINWLTEITAQMESSQNQDRAQPSLAQADGSEQSTLLEKYSGLRALAAELQTNLNRSNRPNKV